MLSKNILSAFTFLLHRGYSCFSDSPKSNRSSTPVTPTKLKDRVKEDSGVENISNCTTTESADEPAKVQPKSDSKPKQPVKEVHEDSTDNVTVRRSQRRIKRSIFSTYRREMREKKSANRILEDMEEESSEEESEKEETRKRTSPEKEEKDEEEDVFSEDDHLTSDGFGNLEGRVSICTQKGKLRRIPH